VDDGKAVITEVDYPHRTRRIKGLEAESKALLMCNSTVCVFPRPIPSYLKIADLRYLCRDRLNTLYESGSGRALKY